MKQMSAGIFLAVCAATGTQAAPTYTIDQATGCGTWCYGEAVFPDPPKLTDGVVGRAGWAANAGEEWLGWVNQPVVNIDFDFGTSTLISSVSIGSTQDNVDDVALPSFQVFEWVSGAWSLKGSLLNPPSSANDHSSLDTSPHALYTLAGLDIHSQFVRVAVLANGPWSFVDEVIFTPGPTAVPEPASAALVLAGLGVVAAQRRRRRQ
jgi:hypothetical protein